MREYQVNRLTISFGEELSVIFMTLALINPR